MAAILPDPVACEVCGKPVMNHEQLARLLLTLRESLSDAPRDAEDLKELPACIHDQIRPMLLGVASELLGFHLACRLATEAATTN